VTTSRLESFSDAVIAVAITLLVLNIAVPTLTESHHGARLGHALGAQWPIYAAYVTSFITIGIIWVNHHVMIGRLARADHSILMLNLVLLLTIAVIPFGTSLLAEYLREGHGAKLAALVYGGIFLIMGCAFVMVNRQILFGRPHLLAAELSFEQRRKIMSRGATGVVPYVVATALAVVSPYATLAICGAVAVFYALPSSFGVGES
jgi:uncharacterized membrane protein